MYTLPSKLKLFAIIFMVVGAIGVVAGFVNAPSSKDEVKEMLAHQDHHGSHAADDVHAHDDEHIEHVFHQVQNRPWSAVYIAAFFFFMIALGVLAFYAIQNAAQAGWSPVLFRVMEGITAYLLPGSLIILLLLLLSAFHVNHIFHWMDPQLVDPSNENYDALIAGKKGWLNPVAFIIRAIIYIAGWNIFRYLLKRNSLRQDEATDNTWFKKNFKLSAGFLVFFIVTESMMSWDWIMSFDPHWFSTLFGWYVLSGMLVSAVTVIALITIYLKSKGYLEYVNNSHIHDLAKFMFGFSIFWTYLWFSQFMLQWYSNIPEEVTYFIFRIEEYNLPFFMMLPLNFLLPVLLLINTDFKRLSWIIVMAGIAILVGHYLDFFTMIMPGTVGANWSIGAAEIGSILFFGGLFIYVGFNAMTKAPLLVKNDPYIEESKHFHY